jgi:hypothetical protein
MNPHYKLLDDLGNGVTELSIVAKERLERRQSPSKQIASSKTQQKKRESAGDISIVTLGDHLL